MAFERASRRAFLVSTALLAGGTAMTPAGRLLAQPEGGDTAEDAFIWGVPLVLTGRYLDIAAQAGVALNQFTLNPDLATPKTRALGAQVDTLYGLGWLDLAPSPQVVEVPDTNDRYYSIQLIDAYQDAFAYIGRRATGTKAGAFVLTPPGFSGQIPAGLTEIKAPTAKILAFVRTLVRGPDDLPAARQIHGSYTLGSLAEYPNGRRQSVFRTEAIDVIPVIDLSTAGIGYYEALNQLAGAYPPLDFDTANFARFAPLGVQAGRPAPADPALHERLLAAIPTGLNRVRTAAFSPEGRWSVNGWSTKLNIANITRDPLTRASQNLYGPGTHVAQEALYFSAHHGPDGQSLTGAQRYRLRFAAGQLPPADAFWSVGVYTKDLYLYDNAINRYSITDRTKGLRIEPDGSLVLAIQHEPPAEGVSNWLPTPADGFSLTVRTYQPRPEVLNKQYHLPPLQIV